MTLNEQIQQILTQENAQLEERSWQGKLKRVWQSENRKQAIKAEFFAILRGLSKKALFTVFLIIAFVFMLTLSVL